MSLLEDGIDLNQIHLIEHHLVILIDFVFGIVFGVEIQSRESLWKKMIQKMKEQ